jgi:hypothetical protein
MKSRSSVPHGPRAPSVSRSIHNEVTAKIKNVFGRLEAEAEEREALVQADAKDKEERAAYAAALMQAYSRPSLSTQPANRAQPKSAEHQPQQQKPSPLPVSNRSHHRVMSLPFGYIWCGTGRPTPKELARLAQREEQKRSTQNTAQAEQAMEQYHTLQEAFLSGQWQPVND